MAIVNDKLNANKPQPVVDPKRPNLNNNKDLEVENKEDASFFGSFFKGQPKKKGVAAMEAVSALPFRNLNIRVKRTSHSLRQSSGHRPHSAIARRWRPRLSVRV